MISDSLKVFAEALGAEPVEGDNIAAVINSIVAVYGGDTSAYSTEGAILNLAAVADKIKPAKVLVEKTITANGTYDPADDEADGYSSVVVNVG